MNLLTQGVLNIVTSGGWPLGIYIIYNLIFLELFVFVVEIVDALMFVKEHNRVRRVVFVLIANLMSLILGGWLITALAI